MTSLNFSTVPNANRIHIAFFGCTNAGKSSLVNAFVGQNLSITSPVKGTTTDAVKKAMELLPFGPIVVIDTAGFDDNSVLGAQRIEKTKEVLRKTDLAILVVDAVIGLNKKDRELIELFNEPERKTPYIVAFNKSDLLEDLNKNIIKENEIYVSAKNNTNIFELKEMAGKFIQKISNEKEKLIVADKLKPKDTVILVTPIDEAAPKGRLILPQQLVLKELLDNHITAIVCQTEELKDILNKLVLNPPNLVVTDSQAFKEVKDIVPSDIKLTSFSILFANFKGELKPLIEGIKKIKALKEDTFIKNANILIAEGCTHHRQCNDIGSVKIPYWLKEYTKKDFNFEFMSGYEFIGNKQDLSKYDLIIHCGGCMLNEKEMKSRLEIAKENNIPIVNYGIFISYINGVLERSLEIFPEILEELGTLDKNNG